MSGIPYEHACDVIRFIGQNVVDFVDTIYTRDLSEV